MILTKSGLLASLQTALEFGYKQCENGHNLLHAQCEAEATFEALCKAENLPTEIAKLTLKNLSDLRAIGRK